MAPPKTKKTRKEALKGQEQTVVWDLLKGTQEVTAWEDIRQLICQYIQLLSSPVKGEEIAQNPVWEKIFGVKDSGVVNLQKLLQMLMMVEEKMMQIETSRLAAQQLSHDHKEQENLQDEELKLLRDWLNTQL